MAESKEELKSLLMKGKEESGKAGLILSTQKPKIMASCSITSWKLMGKQWTGSKLGKEYVKAVYYHPGYLAYMQSTS